MSVGNSFAAEILVGVEARRVEVGRDVVGQAPIDLLRHVGLVAAEAGLDMGHRIPLLRGDQGTGKSRVDVADHDDDARCDPQQLLLEREHDLCRLLAVTPRADAEKHIRLRQVKLVEEHPGQLVVVVLPRVDDRAAQPDAASRLHDRGRLHEIWARADNDEKVRHVDQRYGGAGARTPRDRLSAAVVRSWCAGRRAQQGADGSGRGGAPAGLPGAAAHDDVEPGIVEVDLALAEILARHAHQVRDRHQDVAVAAHVDLGSWA